MLKPHFLSYSFFLTTLVDLDLFVFLLRTTMDEILCLKSIFFTPPSSFYIYYSKPPSAFPDSSSPSLSYSNSVNYLRVSFSLNNCLRAVSSIVMKEPEELYSIPFCKLSCRSQHRMLHRRSAYRGLYLSFSHQQLA